RAIGRSLLVAPVRLCETFFRDHQRLSLPGNAADRLRRSAAARRSLKARPHALTARAHQMSPARKSSARRALVRAANAMAVNTGFFSGPVVNTAESATATLRAANTRQNRSTTP